MLPNLGGGGMGAAGLGLGGDLSGLGPGFSAAALGGLAGNNPLISQLGANNSLLGAGMSLVNFLGKIQSCCIQYRIR